jgi:outer membrane protein assembly factor BamA
VRINTAFFIFLFAPFFAQSISAQENSESITNEKKITGVIQKITINNQDVFDLNITEENNPLYRMLNKIHVNTRKDVIRSQLLFQSGDTYSKRIADETERLLRANRYLTNADIEVIPRNSQNIDLKVNTQDAWTLNPGFSFGRGGGHNKTSISLREYNFLGSGTRIGLRYKSDIDRDSTTFQLSDNNLIGSRYSLIFDFANNSDGNKYLFNLKKPFYSLNTTDSHGISVANQTSIESLYSLGAVDGQFTYSSKNLDVYKAFSNGLNSGWAKRYLVGLTLDDNEYSTNSISNPLDSALLSGRRRHSYPYLGIEFVEDNFIEEKNFDNIGLVEDRHIGSKIHAKIGYASKNIDATSNAWFVEAGYNNSLIAVKDKSLLFTSLLTGRFEKDQKNSIKLNINTRYDVRLSTKRLMHLEMDAIIGQNLDINNRPYLGGDNKLRGYPARYQTGNSRIVFTIEQRYFTDWYPFRIARIGGAIFMDIGKTWDDNNFKTPQMGWLKNAGFGLRIANSRSEVGRVLHIDIAYPLDGSSDLDKLQLLIDAKKGF